MQNIAKAACNESTTAITISGVGVNSVQQPYRIMPHTADVKICAYGTSLQELFSNALRGMFEIQEPHKKEPPLPTCHRVEVQASQLPYLLVDFLSECLYFSDKYNETYDNATIDTLSDTYIHATINGYGIEGFGGPEIKAVTYHDIAIEQTNGVWQATIVFDI